MKYGNLNFLEPSGLLQACNGTAFLLCVWSHVCGVFQKIMHRAYRIKCSRWNVIRPRSQWWKHIPVVWSYSTNKNVYINVWSTWRCLTSCYDVKSSCGNKLPHLHHHQFYHYGTCIHFRGMVFPLLGFWREFLWGESVSPMPNLQPGGPGYLYGISLKTWLAWVALLSARLLPGWILSSLVHTGSGTWLNMPSVQWMSEQGNKLLLGLDNDQLDAHMLYFSIRPLQSPTCFEHYMLIIRRLIALMQHLVSSSQSVAVQCTGW